MGTACCLQLAQFPRNKFNLVGFLFSLTEVAAEALWMEFLGGFKRLILSSQIMGAL